MGYNTSVIGRIGIEPPLTWAEIQASPFKPSLMDDADLDVCLDIAEEKVDTDEGELIRRTAGGLLPRWEDEYRAYHLVEHVQKAVDSFPGHTFTGRLECEGEENTDMWRVVIRDGRAVRVEPRIVWPDES
jgi:hypothetical protein